MMDLPVLEEKAEERYQRAQRRMKPAEALSSCGSVGRVGRREVTVERGVAEVVEVIGCCCS